MKNEIKDFFPEGYCYIYPDIKENNFDPLEHYNSIGKKEGRNNGLNPPKTIFFPEGYLFLNPDIANLQMSPWEHFVLHGSKEGRGNGLNPPNDVFFPEGYLFLNPDIANSQMSPWEHFVLHGSKEGRGNGLNPPNDVFFPEGYLFLNPDIKNSDLTPWQHFVLFGKNEGRGNGLNPPKEAFSEKEYLFLNPDVKNSGLSPWQHFILNGIKEGRSVDPRKKFDFREKFDTVSTFKYNNIKEILNNKNIKVVSFDIFDTLLCRPVIEPEDIFVLVDQIVKKKFKIDFLQARKSVPHHLDINANINEIYKELEKELNIDKNISRIIMDIELEVEKNLFQRRDDIYQIFLYAKDKGFRIIAISDMYLSSEFLKYCLSNLGYDYISELYISNEYNKRKDFGELYDVVLQRENIKNFELLHIGDNIYSDYKVPLSKGIVAFPINSMKSMLFSSHTLWSKINFNDPFIKIIFGFLANNYFTDSKYKNSKEIFPTLFSFGYIGLSLILITVLLSILNNETIIQNYKKINFASRDGYLPIKACKILLKYVDFPIKNVKYFESGRLLYYTLYKHDFSDFITPTDEFDVKNITLREYITSIIHDKETLKDILEKLNNEEKNIYLDSVKYVQTMTKVKNQIEKYIYKENNNIKKYYKNILCSNRNIVFDCGYSGSVSEALMNATGKKVDKIYLWNTEKDEKINIKNKTKTFSIFGRLTQEYSNPLMHVILEELFSPLNRRPYSVNEDGTPLYAIENISNEMIDDLTTIQNSALISVEKFAQHFNKFMKYFEFTNPRDCLEPILFSILKSPYSEYMLLKNICFDDICFKKSKTLAEKIENSRSYKLNNLLGVEIVNPSIYIDDSDYAVIRTEFKIGIHVHLYNEFLIYEIAEYISNLPNDCEIYITTPKHNVIHAIELIAESILKNRSITIIKTQNRGRDVAPWLIEMKKYHDKFDLFCHIHSKCSEHWKSDEGDKWRRYLLDNLLSKKAINDIFSLFSYNKNIGIIAPEPYIRILDLWNGPTYTPIGSNKNLIKKILKRAYNKNIEIKRGELAFSLGTMFWYRPRVLSKIFNIDLKYEDFPKEPIGIDGTLAHAFERVWYEVCQFENVEFKYYPGIHPHGFM